MRMPEMSSDGGPGSIRPPMLRPLSPMPRAPWRGAPPRAAGEDPLEADAHHRGVVPRLQVARPIDQGPADLPRAPLRAQDPGQLVVRDDARQAVRAEEQR